MRRVVLISYLVYLSSGANGNSLSDTIKNLYGPPENKTAEQPTTTATAVVDLQDKNLQPSENKNCKCVPYYLCNLNNTITHDGIGLIDIHGGSGGCESYLDVCCDPRNTEVVPIERPKQPIRECGYRNPGGIDIRFTSDTQDEAQFGEFPWMLAVLAEEFSSATNTTLDIYKCGASLIHPQAVLTAAHCVPPRDRKYKIRAGEWDTQTTKELFPHQDRYVRKIVIHNKYYAGGLINDIAILFLESPFTLAESINLLCLPEQGVVIPSGTRCIANGWGKDVFDKEEKYQVILKKIELPMVDRKTCQDQLRTTRLGKNFDLDDSFICAGGEVGKDTCKGDGGSPLACPIPDQKDRYQHVGIVSWGIGCGEDQIPGVYVNVGMFRQWIDEQMTSQNLDKSPYQY